MNTTFVIKIVCEQFITECCKQKKEVYTFLGQDFLKNYKFKRQFGIRRLPNVLLCDTNIQKKRENSRFF